MKERLVKERLAEDHSAEPRLGNGSSQDPSAQPPQSAPADRPERSPDRRRAGRGIPLPPGLVKVCAGVVECAGLGPCTVGDARFPRAVAQAESALAAACPDLTEGQRTALSLAIRHNLISRKRYPAEGLLCHHGLPITRRRFFRERRRYCRTLLSALGLLPA